MSAILAAARSFLFVPASQPGRFAKALESGADCVIVDLEDAVAPQDKVTARNELCVRLSAFEPAQLARTLVRINSRHTPWHADDVQMLADWTHRGLAGIMVPKAEASVLHSIGSGLSKGVSLIPLIESLEGCDAIDLIAQAPQVVRLAFGHLDFQLDMGMRCSAEESELASIRLALVAGSRRAQISAPIDGVTTDARNAERTAADARRARGFGFGGKLCIHPDQVAKVNETFAVAPEELVWAQKVIEAARQHEGRAFSLDGFMVDLPVVRRAQRMLLYAGVSATFGEAWANPGRMGPEK